MKNPILSGQREGKPQISEVDLRLLSQNGLLAGLEAVLQADGPVEYQVTGSTVLAVGAEVAQTHELIGSGSLGILQAGLNLTAGENLQRIGVHAGQEILAGSIGIRIIKKIGVLADLSIGTGLGIHPMDGGTLDLPAIGGVAALGLGIIGGQNLGDVAVFVLDAAGAGDQISTLQAALRSVGIQSLILGNGLGQEVVGLNPKIPGEGDLPGTGLLVAETGFWLV